MNQNLLNSKATFSFLVFAGLSPLAFYFNRNGLIFLMNSSYAYITWTLILLATFLIATEKTLNKKQLLALTLFYSCLPLTCYFNENHRIFVFLTQNAKIAILLWIASVILLYKFFKKKTV